MNTKDFVKALRAVIREEVRAAVRQEVKAILSENTRAAEPSIRQQRQAQPLKKYTGNSILDQVLNETKLTSDFRQSTDVVYEDFGTFTTEDVKPIPQLTSMMDMDVNDDMGGDLPSVNTSALPFMKDYTALMKKADQISQGRF